MCLALCLSSGYILPDEQEAQGLLLYLGWTLKDLEEFKEGSYRKQSRQRFWDKIKMVDMEEQKAYLEQVLLIEAQRTWYHGDKKRNNWGFKQGQEVSKYVHDTQAGLGGELDRAWE